MLSYASCVAAHSSCNCRAVVSQARGDVHGARAVVDGEVCGAQGPLAVVRRAAGGSPPPPHTSTTHTPAFCFTHARTHAHTHTREHAPTHTQTHAHSHLSPTPLLLPCLSQLPHGPEWSEYCRSETRARGGDADASWRRCDMGAAEITQVRLVPPAAAATPRPHSQPPPLRARARARLRARDCARACGAAALTRLQSPPRHTTPHVRSRPTARRSLPSFAPPGTATHARTHAGAGGAAGGRGLAAAVRRGAVAQRLADPRAPPAALLGDCPPPTPCPCPCRAAPMPLHAHATLWPGRHATTHCPAHTHYQ